MAFTQVTLAGTFHDETGGAQAGTLTFSLARSMSNSGVVVTPAAITVTLDANGSISQPLVANTDQDTTPQGVWYGVTEQISGGRPRDYFIQIPGTTTDDSATLTDGSDLVSLGGVRAMAWMVGCQAAGAGIPADATIVAVLQGANQVQISQAATASGAGVSVTVSPPQVAGVATVDLSQLVPGDTQWL